MAPRHRHACCSCSQTVLLCRQKRVSATSGMAYILPSALRSYSRGVGSPMETAPRVCMKGWQARVQQSPSSSASSTRYSATLGQETASQAASWVPQTYPFCDRTQDVPRFMFQQKTEYNPPVFVRRLSSWLGRTLIANVHPYLSALSIFTCPCCHLAFATSIYRRRCICHHVSLVSWYHNRQIDTSGSTSSYVSVVCLLSTRLGQNHM